MTLYGISIMIKPATTFILTLLAALLLQAPMAAAAESREITWDDLVPAEAQFDDVFTRLDEDTLYSRPVMKSTRTRSPTTRSG